MLIPVILIPLLFLGSFLSFSAINFLYRQAETQVVSDNPVSYTHLDVYKRQLGLCFVLPAMIDPEKEEVFSTTFSLAGDQGEAGAVSYTHLDVYKRQRIS